MLASLQKRYEYKIFRNGLFLGILQDVQSDFAYYQNINSAGSQLPITVAKSADTANLAVSPILDETGEIITDELGEAILEERAPDVVGDAADNILIRNDNDVVVYEFSNYYPNGIVVFKGYISKWKVIFGGDDNIVITVLSHGQDFNNYVNPGGTADTLDQSQTTYDIGSFLNGPFLVGGVQQNAVTGQEILVGAGVTNLSAFIFKLASITGESINVPVSVWSSAAAASANQTPLATTSTTIDSTSPSDTLFTLAVPIPVLSGQRLFIAVYINEPRLSVYFSNSHVYSDGNAYISGVGGVLSLPLTLNDLYFKTYYSVNSTVITYTNSDPSTTLTSIMDYYISSGGSIAKQPGGYDLTGVLPVQTVFKLNTILEALQKLIGLAPSDWYWYVDPSNDILYFKQAAVSATHRLIKGLHIQSLEIEATKENITNVAYFTGGDTGGGQNLFINVNDTLSLVENRRGLIRLSDNRVTDVSTGQLIAQNYIDQNNEQTYITQVTVTDSTYDINLFNIGEIVAIEDYGNFVDDLLLQIVGITRNIDTVILWLGVLPARQTALTEQLGRELADIQTIDNPTTPS